MRRPPRASVASGLLLALALIALPGWLVSPARADLMVIGNDQKVAWDFPLMNSIFGPPTNLAITPGERLAIVANSVNWVQDGAAWKPAPDDKLPGQPASMRGRAR